MSKRTPAPSSRPSSRPSSASPRPKRRRPAAPPWIINGTDYGPAVLAIEDLLGWAFDLAHRNVADWPEGKRRVQRTRRALLDRLHGRRARASDEDVLFTAALLVRILDADLGLGLGDVLSVLVELGLPTADVPYPPVPPRRPGRRVQPPPAPPTPAPAAFAVLLGGRAAPLAPVLPLGRPRAVVAPSCPAAAGFAVAA